MTTIVWTYGVLAPLGYKINVVSTIIPPLLLAADLAPLRQFGPVAACGEAFAVTAALLPWLPALVPAGRTATTAAPESSRSGRLLGRLGMWRRTRALAQQLLLVEGTDDLRALALDDYSEGRITPRTEMDKSPRIAREMAEIERRMHAIFGATSVRRSGLVILDATHGALPLGELLPPPLHCYASCSGRAPCAPSPWHGS